MPLVEDEDRYIPGEDKYWVAWSRISGVGIATIRKLGDYFGSLEEAWEAKSSQLLATGMHPKLVDRTLAFRQEFEPDREMETLAKQQIQVLTRESPDFPYLLSQTDDAPAVLYLKGEIIPPDENALGVVGTRKATGYGKNVTHQFVDELARQGLTIISGLARGIDTAAHSAALKAGGRTIAVFGCGLDVMYPPENKKLAEEILANGQGALVSEQPPGVQPFALNFPARNRIISGLSKGVLVVESNLQGGALSTAKFANAQGRTVFAIPGSIFNESSKGTNQLIKDGATMVTAPEDILEALNFGHLEIQTEVQEVMGDNEVEKCLLRVMLNTGAEPVHIDDICLESGLSIAVVSSTLVVMELKGKITNLGGMRYVLTSRKR